VIRPARPSLAEVPLADLSVLEQAGFIHSFTFGFDIFVGSGCRNCSTILMAD
jgi:hypothetical protein